MPGEHLLIVDDEDNLRSMLAAALRHHGFEVSTVANGRDALTAVAEDSPDLVVLDVMLPDLDGFEVCRRMRADGDRTPGAVPHRPRRHRGQGPRAHARRRRLRAEAVQPRGAGGPGDGRAPAHRPGSRGPDRLTCADLTMDDDAHRVTRGGVEVALSPTEYNLLRYLLVNQGRVLSKAQILDHVWQYDFGGDGGVVETYIGYLRRKLDTDEPRLITTIRGVGYTLPGPGAAELVTARPVAAGQGPRRHGPGGRRARRRRHVRHGDDPVVPDRPGRRAPGPAAGRPGRATSAGRHRPAVPGGPPERLSRPLRRRHRGGRRARHALRAEPERRRSRRCPTSTPSAPPRRRRRASRSPSARSAAPTRGTGCGSARVRRATCTSRRSRSATSTTTISRLVTVELVATLVIVVVLGRRDVVGDPARASARSSR